jgi:ABC-type multidrug transport system fused ATPase/permease subunit
VVLVIGAFTSVAANTRTRSQVLLLQLISTQDFWVITFSFLKIEALLPVPEKPTSIPDGPVDNISFENISFHYPGGHGEAIENLNLNIRRGELIALVGENGAGKSTLVKLLLRFYDIQKGSIKIGGVDLKDMDPETYAVALEYYSRIMLPMNFQ